MLNNRTRRDVIFNRVPSKADLDAGDLVVNSADGIAYTKLSTGQVVPIAGRSISGESGGSSFELPVATDAVLGGIKVGANLSITADGVLSAQQGEDGFVLLPATRSTLGGVIVGARLTVGPDGTLSADAQSLPIASGTVLGGVRVGQGLSIDGSGVLTAAASGYTLPPATNTTLGGIKVGTNLTVTPDGTLNAGVSGSDRVLRAGDTMTGKLTINSPNNAPHSLEIGADLAARVAKIALVSPNIQTEWGAFVALETYGELSAIDDLWVMAGRLAGGGSALTLSGTHNSGTGDNPIIFRRGTTRIAGIDWDGNYVRTSDKMAKTAAAPLEEGLAKVLALQPRSFRYLPREDDAGPGPVNLGFIAEEVQEVVPEAVSPAVGGLLGLKEAALIPVLVSAVQELAARVAALEGV
jgi:hypothetical protein